MLASRRLLLIWYGCYWAPLSVLCMHWHGNASTGIHFTHPYRAVRRAELRNSQCRTHVLRSTGRSDYSGRVMSNTSIMHAYAATSSGLLDRVCGDQNGDPDCMPQFADRNYEYKSSDHISLMEGYVMCFENRATSMHGRSLATGLKSIYGILKGHARHSIVNESCVQLSATPLEVHQLLRAHPSGLIASIHPAPSHSKFSREHLAAATDTLDSDSDAFHLLVALIPGIADASKVVKDGLDAMSYSTPSSSSSASLHTMRSLVDLITQLPCELTIEDLNADIIPGHISPRHSDVHMDSRHSKGHVFAVPREGMHEGESRLAPSQVLLLRVEKAHWESVVAALALHGAVSWMEPRAQYRVTNYHAQYLCLSHSSEDGSSGASEDGFTDSEYNVFQVFNLTGKGHVVGISDTGIDRSSCFFQDDFVSDTVKDHRSYAGAETQRGSSDASRSASTSTSGGRVGNSSSTSAYGGGSSRAYKIVYYEAYADSQDDAMGHGTHVAASAAGKSVVPGYQRYNGVAPDAQIAFVDIGHSSTGSLYVPGDLYAMFQRMYEAGARVFSNSWGAASYVMGANRYSFDARNVDLFMYNYPDALVLFAAGNQGSNGAGSVVTPSTNKNGVCVGASINNDQSWISLTGRSLYGIDGRAVAYFSSYGPTEDLRLKPDILAPGWWVTSARSMGEDNCELISYSGTSMASPIAAGVAVLIRDYFTSGFYPSGRRTASDAFIPSGALIKAVMVHSGRQVKHLIKLGGSKSSLNSTYPSNIQGYGLLGIASVLNFEMPTYPYLSLFVRGAAYSSSPYYASLSASGDIEMYEVKIPPWIASNTPLRVTMVYTDAVNTYYSSSNSRAMVNILALKVTCKTTGQVFSPLNTDGTVAMVHIPSAVPNGMYSISVIGSYVLKSQPFALVATCNVSPPKHINGSARDGYDSTFETSTYSTTVPVYRAIFVLIYSLPVFLALRWKYHQMVSDFHEEGDRLRELYERLNSQSRVDFRQVDTSSRSSIPPVEA